MYWPYFVPSVPAEGLSVENIKMVAGHHECVVAWRDLPQLLASKCGKCSFYHGDLVRNNENMQCPSYFK